MIYQIGQISKGFTLWSRRIDIGVLRAACYVRYDFTGATRSIRLDNGHKEINFNAPLDASVWVEEK